MQNPNLNIMQALWFSACGASLLWFMYWIFYDLIVWSKPLVAVYPLNYFGVALSVSLILFSGLGVRKLESLCYLGSTASLIWFTYWIMYDIIVWNKPFVEVNTVNYIGVVVSLWLILVPKLVSLKPKKEIIIETKTVKPPTRTLIIPKAIIPQASEVVPQKTIPQKSKPKTTPKSTTKIGRITIFIIEF